MNGQELKIKFFQDKAYLIDGIALSFDQLGLPDIAKTFQEPAYWIIKVLNYLEGERKIFCKIISYRMGSTKFEPNQLSFSDSLRDIQVVTFRGIDTIGLLKTLAGNRASAIRSSKFDLEGRAIEINGQTPKQKIQETIFIPLKKVIFNLGSVSFKKKFKEHERPIEIIILNPDIKEEFDAIKNYFSNVLGTKKISVNVHIEILNDEVSVIESKSPEIDKIDKQLVENVKFEFIRSTIGRAPSPEAAESLLTMEDYFDTVSNGELSSGVFYSNDKEFFEDLLKITNTKHYRHLRFLSSRHSHHIIKLKFFPKPFSFIFLIKGVNNYYVVWETLNTEEATYIWHFSKEERLFESNLKKIEGFLKLISLEGKMAYIGSAGDSFARIYHDYSDPIEGFIKWKEEFENLVR